MSANDKISGYIMVKLFSNHTKNMLDEYCYRFGLLRAWIPGSGVEDQGTQRSVELLQLDLLPGLKREAFPSGSGMLQKASLAACPSCRYMN